MLRNVLLMSSCAESGSDVQIKTVHCMEMNSVRPLKRLNNYDVMSYYRSCIF